MTKMELASVIGSAAGLITVLSFIPQVVRVWKTKRTQDLSVGTFSLLVVQSAGWTAYGVLLGQQPIIWTNVCVMVLTLAILTAKLKHG